MIDAFRQIRHRLTGDSYALRLWRATRDRYHRFPRHSPFLGHDFLGPGMMRRGEYALDICRLLEAESKRLDAFLDIGANVGFFTCVAAKHYKKVVSIEPNIATFDMLLRNSMFAAMRHKECDLIPLCFAAGASRRIQPFFGAGGMTSLVAGWDGAKKMTGACVVDKIDSHIHALGPIRRAFVKIDVEGFECDCIEGMRSLIGGLDEMVVVVEVSVSDHRADLGDNPNIARLQDSLAQLGCTFHGAAGDAERSVVSLVDYLDRSKMTSGDFVWRKN